MGYLHSVQPEVENNNKDMLFHTKLMISSWQPSFTYTAYFSETDTCANNIQENLLSLISSQHNDSKNEMFHTCTKSVKIFRLLLDSPL